MKWNWRSKAAIFVLATVASIPLEKTRLAQYLTEVTFDENTRAKAAAPYGQIVLVTIDDDSYDKDFQKNSPLNKVNVTKLIQNADRGGAAVIGVDIDTEACGTGVPAEVVCGHTDPDKGAYVGIAPARADNAHERNETGIVRTHPLAQPPSFSDTIVARYCAGRSDCLPGATQPEEGPEAKYIRFVRRAKCDVAPCPVSPLFPTIPAHTLMLADPKDLESAQTFAGKIVIIGGTAKLLHDVYRSPFGPEAGLELHAEMVSSRLAGPKAPLSFGIVLLIEGLFGLVLFGAQLAVNWLADHYSKRTGWWIERTAAIGIPGFAILAVGGLVYLSFDVSQAFYAFPILALGVLINDWMDAVRETYPDGGEQGPALETMELSEYKLNVRVATQAASDAPQGQGDR